MSNFDKDWFEDLAKITESHVDGARAMMGISEHEPYPYQHVTYLGEMYTCGLVSQDLHMTACELVCRLSRTRYIMSPHFRVHPGHIYTFPKGEAYRWQTNIAFSSGESYQARIGIGFDIRTHERRSVDDYIEFRQKLALNSQSFNTIFRSLGSYSEPEEIFENQDSLADAILCDNNWADSWRFYGRVLRHDIPEDRIILESMDRFVDEVLNVFDTLRNAGFLK